MKHYITITLLILSLCLLASSGHANENFTPLEQIIRKSRTEMSTKLIRRIAYVIETESHRQNLNPDLVAAHIWVESRFLYSATGRVGEVGLMQIRYKTWKNSIILKQNGVTSRGKLYWIGKNIQCGTQILSRFLKYAKGDIVKALHRYNSGKPNLPGQTMRHEIDYANKVLIKMYEISEQKRIKSN